MDYKITESQLDRILKPFFDKEFEGSEWGKYNDQYGGGKWYGYVNQDGVILAGHPSHDDSILFTNGQHFTNMWDLFSISPQDFNEAIGRYIKMRYDKTFGKIM